MAEHYLLPEDVSPEHARQVLDFLNRAASAQVIADAVELPRERDVVVRVAQRILDRRAELNGFRTLDELYAVPYVGPERFTEIVVCLSGARPPRGDGGVTTTELADLRRSIEALRAMLQPVIQARLWSVQDTIWLGQNATLLVQLNDSGGRALVDQPVTVVTSWGELTALNTVEPIWNNTSAGRTDDAGMVELRLRTRFEAPLSAAQRLALEVAVGQLPLTAPWPTEASRELTDFVARYRAPGSDDLREAVDAAFREYAASVDEAQNRGQGLAQWSKLAVNIVCFVHDDGDEKGFRHLALATHTLTVRNWLPAFLAAFEHDVPGDKGLAGELRRAPHDVADANVFLNDVFITVQSYLNTERGELGQAVRTRAAQQELQQFLQTDVARLPAESRLSAAGGVFGASRTIGDGGLALFTAVDATRRDTKLNVDFTAGLLEARLSTLERTAITTQQIDDLRTQILAQARADTEVQIGQQLALKADVSAVNTLQARADALARDIAEANAATTGLRGDVNGLSTSISGLNTRVTRDLTNFGSRLDGVESRLGGR
jgi:hypothetical protein